MDTSEIIKKIKEKKSLNQTDNNLVLEKVNNYLKQKKIDITKLNLRSADFKKIIKEVRNELNRIYGCFNLDNKFSLESNSSTKERIKIYPRLYKNIFAITGEPKTIVDLSCGFNPLSYKFIPSKCDYIVSELNKSDCDRLKNYFEREGLNAKVIQIDLSKETNLPSGDVCFLFKILESIEQKGHKIAERIIKTLKCRFIVVSFSTKTLRGNKMKFPRRIWFEVMLKRLGMEYERLDYENELFYIINKEQS